MYRKPNRHCVVQSLLASAAIAAVSLEPAAGDIGVSETLSETVAIETLDDQTLCTLAPSDRVRILQLFARDSRLTVRATVAKQLRHVPIPLTHSGRKLLAELADDPSPDVQHATARSLAILITQMPGLDRTHLVSTWANSGRHGLELVTARALEYSIDVLGSEVAIEHLSTNPSADVRLATVRAAWVRRSLDPLLFHSVVERLASDTDPSMAEMAALVHVA